MAEPIPLEDLLKFIPAGNAAGHTISELSAAWGIPRSAAHKKVRLFVEKGMASTSRGHRKAIDGTNRFVPVYVFTLPEPAVKNPKKQRTRDGDVHSS